MLIFKVARSNNDPPVQTLGPFTHFWFKKFTRKCKTVTSNHFKNFVFGSRNDTLPLNRAYLEFFLKCENGLSYALLMPIIGTIPKKNLTNSFWEKFKKLVLSQKMFHFPHFEHEKNFHQKSKTVDLNHFQKDISRFREKLNVDYGQKYDFHPL